MPNWTLHQGECLDVLKNLPDNSVDSVVTDPPYGLSNYDAGDVREALRCWLDGKPYTPKGSGFMGKGWDAFVPGPEVWSECLRVLKPGGHLLVFAGTRTQDLMGIAVRLAGFDARDTVIVQGMLHWNYGSGFPKSLDVSKAIDKAAGAERSRTPRIRSDGKATGKVVTGFDAFDLDATTQYGPPITDAAKQWDGWGTALKPSQEPVLVFRKPLDGTVAYNVLKYGTGGINIDGCRLASQSGTGRWPTNTVFCHTPECVRVGTVKVKSNNAVLKNTVEGELLTSYGGGLKQRPHGEYGYADEDGTETVDRWECVDGCPVAVLDAQSGECPGMKPHRLLRGATTGAGVGYGKGAPQDAGVIGRGDTGTASRFFPQFAADDPDAPFRYIAKPSRAEKNAGCEGLPQTAGASVAKVAGGKVMRCGECSRTHPMTHRGPCARCGSDAVEVDDAADDGSGRDGCRVRGNHHPTVKPIALMRWLARLVTPTNGVVLDPFNGSGTTGCAAVLEGFQYIGIEREPEYVEIARARITHHERVVQGGVKNPWTENPTVENPTVENPTVEATETAPTTLDDLFGF